MPTSNRYIILDSYRALAALYVVAFHFFYRWTSSGTATPLVEWTPILSSAEIVRHGYLGVEFFFIISGFVIALTLRSTQSIMDFAVKRFARLFPAMLVCATVTYIVVRILDVRPLSDVNAVDFLPSLTFVSPEIYNKVFGLDSDWISGVYWSLFVEVKFYFIAAVVYFLFPKQFLKIFFWLALGLCSLYWVAVFADMPIVKNVLYFGFFPKYAFLFVAGMAFRDLHADDSDSIAGSIVMILFSLTYSLFIYSPLNPEVPGGLFAMAMILVFFTLFALFVVDSRVLHPLKSKFLAKIGAASYSLYLLHESVGVSVINIMKEYVVSSAVWTFLVIIGVVALSILIYERVETPARRLIRRWYVEYFKIRSTVQATRQE